MNIITEAAKTLGSLGGKAATGKSKRCSPDHYKRIGKITRDKFFNTFPERFWAKIKIGSPDECWIWQGCVNSKNYGVMRRLRIMHCSHRWAWILTNGEIPESICVLHKCDTPRCCNPSHLFLGTHRDNMHDMIRKGRDRHDKKLNKTKVLEIKTLLADGNMTGRAIGKMFGVGPQTICDIRKGRVWKSVV